VILANSFSTVERSPLDAEISPLEMGGLRGTARSLWGGGGFPGPYRNS